MADQAALGESNPAWSAALPTQQWKALNSRLQFKSYELLAAETIAFVPDSDCDFEVELYEWDIGERAKNKFARTAKIANSATGSLGYRITAGRRGVVNLGHFRLDAKAGETVNSTVDMVQSGSGRYLSIVSRFDVGSGPESHRDVQVKIVRLNDTEIPILAASDQNFHNLRRRRIALEQDRLEIVDELFRMAGELNGRAEGFPPVQP